MNHNRDSVLEYWNQREIKSMDDKHLLNAEIRLIRARIAQGAKVLDAGCGEGEGTYAYSSLPGVTVHGVDFSETRLALARERLGEQTNVGLSRVDFLGTYTLDTDFDAVVSQRFLINLLEWNLQMKVLDDLMALLRPGGKLLMLEGSKQGTESLNDFRAVWGLPPIPVRWHNLFFDDSQLVEHMTNQGHQLIEETGLGAYFMLTRGVRPVLEQELAWDCEYNRVAATGKIEEFLGLGARLSRLKLWVFQKVQNN